MATVLAALIALCSALCVMYATQFVAEDYRRFRDGSSVAAALSGELSSYQSAVPILKQAITNWMRAVGKGEREQLVFRPFDRPTDFVLNGVVGKLGLLSPELVESIAFVYGNLNAFRSAFELITKEYKTMDDDELMARCQACFDALDRASTEGEALAAALHDRSTEQFALRLPWWTARASSATMETKDQLVGHRFELSKSVLYLATLGLFAKLLGAETAGAKVLLGGMEFDSKHALLAAGLVGMVLTFTVAALLICITEGATYGHLFGKLQKDTDQMLDPTKRALLVTHSFVKGLGGWLYALPPTFGIIVAVKLWPDTAKALAMLWAVL